MSSISEGPVLDQVNLVVSDMEASAAFYARLGVRLDFGPDEVWAPHHRSSAGEAGIDFDLDGSAFAAVWNAGFTGRTGPVLGFKLASRDAVDTVYVELTGAGYVGQQPPYDAFWGSRYAIVEDPDGNSVGLMSPAEPARRTAPPNPPF